MASLYTPEPQRTGLDWLAGLVRSGQELAQRERQIQLQKKQQQIQMEHFWTEQARLKTQQDFQNRKFLYDVGQDQRQEMRQGLLDDRSWQNTQTDNARADNQQAWARNPANPYVANVQANTRATNARRAWEFGDAEGATGGAGSLFPELPSTEGGGASPEGEDLLGSPEGREDATSSAQPRRGIKEPIEIIPVEGGKVIRTNQYHPSGNLKSSSNRYVPNPAGASEDAVVSKQNNVLSDDLRTLTKSKKIVPAYPAGEEITPQQKETYETRKAGVVAHNAEIDRQSATIKRSIYENNAPAATKRMASTKLDLFDVTPTFEQKLAPAFGAAVASKDPSSLLQVRPQLVELADMRDKTAIQALVWVDNVLGAPLVSLATPAPAPAVEQKAPREIFAPK